MMVQEMSAMNIQTGEMLMITENDFTLYHNKEGYIIVLQNYKFVDEAF